jgi:hypothetical protein
VEIEPAIRARCIWCKPLSADTSTGGQTLPNVEEDAGSLAFAHTAHDVIRGSESSICSCASITLVQQLVRAECLCHEQAFTFHSHSNEMLSSDLIFQGRAQIRQFSAPRK